MKREFAVGLIAVLVTSLAVPSVHPVYWVTAPGAVLVGIFDLVHRWMGRNETREIARRGREDVEAYHPRSSFKRKTPKGRELLFHQDNPLRWNS